VKFGNYLRTGEYDAVQIYSADRLWTVAWLVWFVERNIISDVRSELRH